MTDRVICHVDMDAFYVSVEVLRRPELAGKAVVVGGSGPRGVVAAASYEARRFGVFSAMPSTRARRLCPHAIFLPGDHARYGEVSAQVHEIFESFTPWVEPIALDEAFLDVTGAQRLFGSGHQIADTIRARIADELHLSCSVGVAPTKFVSKLASKAAKPKATPAGVVAGAGVVEVTSDGVLAFLHPQPVQALWGVGPKTLERLQRLGVRTIGDLAVASPALLNRAVGNAHGTHLHDLANGIDPRAVVPDRAAKSIGHEETFVADRHGLGELRPEVVRLADAVASRLRQHHLAARTISIKVRYPDFETLTRAVTVPVPVDDAVSITAAATDLLGTLDLSRGVRLFGISASGLTDEARQMTLDLDGGSGGAAPSVGAWNEVSGALDAIRDRFGAAAIGPATLVRPGQGLKVTRRGEQQWGPTEPPPV